MADLLRNPLRLEDVDGVLVVRFTTPRLVDEARINDVAQHLIRLIDQQGYTQLLLNFEDVAYLSSAVLGTILQVSKKLAAVKGQMKLCGLKDIHLELFRTTKLDKAFRIYPDEQAALDSFF
jgi:anti-sigma B factor antagonist